MPPDSTNPPTQTPLPPIRERSSFLAIGDTLALPPIPPPSTPMADRYAHLLSAILDQARLAAEGIYAPFPIEYLLLAHHYLQVGHRSALRARHRRAGKPFPKSPSLQPATKRTPQLTEAEKAATAQASAALQAFFAAHQPDLEPLPQPASYTPLADTPTASSTLPLGLKELPD